MVTPLGGEVTQKQAQYNVQIDIVEICAKDHEKMEEQLPKHGGKGFPEEHLER